jgi:hypothetical protein
MYDFWMNLCQDGDISNLKKLNKELIQKIEHLEKRIAHLEKYSHQHHEKKETNELR